MNRTLGRISLYCAALGPSYAHPRLRSTSPVNQCSRRVLVAGIKLEGAADHGVSGAIYLSAPDRDGKHETQRKCHAPLDDSSQAS